MRRVLISIVIALTACGADPQESIESRRSVDLASQPTCLDDDADGECDRCMVRLRHEPDEPPFSGPPCRWMGRAYNTALTCGYRTPPFAVDWIRDDTHAVMLWSGPDWSAFFRGRISDRWSVQLLDWRWGDEAEGRGLHGFWQIVDGGAGAFLFSTDLPPPFPIAGCEATTMIADFDPDGEPLRPDLIERAAEFLAEMSRE